ncbi:anti-sigma factor [Uliginosibacterium sp. H1]|uniref:anti-sigma factor n=1 Tax=Uliginosibacterium sp. H1 TaxID=3114757 RepID=UPI002E182EFB|nr:anti-sigma factor [Uliginosibacterium sp. H1]
MNYERPELIDRLASEYALGTLRGPALRRFRRLLASSDAARAAVQGWERHLAALAVSVPSETPSPRVWRGIESRIAPPARASSLWRWLKPALGIACGVILGAAVTLGLVRGMPEVFTTLDAVAEREQALPQSYVGLLLDAENRPTVLASSTRHGRRVTLKILRPIDVPAGKLLQLWALPQDANGQPLTPIPLGVVPPQGRGGFDMPDTAERLLSNVPRLGITLQDAPAQPGDVPGDFLLQGHCAKLW